MSGWGDFFAQAVQNTLPWWGWTLILLVPPAIILLYFLKLVRQPVEVPSTYLWHRTIEDLHVNSLWQQLRQNLLLLLQLLVLLFAILACLRLGCASSQVLGKRFVFLLDTSGSMSANDVSPTRLEVAKQNILDLIERMEPGAVGMLISFSDNARIEQDFTDNRTLLRRKLAEVQPTNRRSDIAEALQAAAALANPGRSGEDPTDVAAAAAQPATAYVVSDGGFPAVPKFQQGNLTIVYLPVGGDPAETRNVGIAAFNADRNPEKITQLQAFARLENYGSEPEKVEVGLYVDGNLRDATEVTIPGKGSKGVEFDLGELVSGKLRLAIEWPKGGPKDQFPLDDVAYAALDARRRTRVLLVTPRNDALELALKTKQATDAAEVTMESPAYLASEQYKSQANLGLFDLVIFDQCAPEKMPQANTLFVGRLPPSPPAPKPAAPPPGPETLPEDAAKPAAPMPMPPAIPGWSAGEAYANPAVIDVDRAHPLMQFVDFGDVLFSTAAPLKGPLGTVPLVDSEVGPIIAVAPREGFEDVVFGFEIYGQEMKDGKLERYPNTNWPIRLSFPLFIRNLLDYFGSRGAAASQAALPGQTVTIRTEAPVDRLSITLPSRRVETLSRGAVPTFSFSATDELGIYEVREGKVEDVTQHLAVNLFDLNECNIAPRDFITAGATKIEAPREALEPARAETWRWLLLIGFITLLVEWYIYNKRIYM